jgi:molybdenum cofactor cytidylyltransferase
VRFGSVSTDQAAGAILAHSIGLPKGRLRKGRALSAADVAALTGAGIATVTVAQPEPGDVLEDEAARRIAAALAPDPAGQRISVSAPFTGRANLYAEAAGVLRVDASAVRALNGIDEAITLATLPDHERVAPRQMLGTVKIIPYGVPGRAVERAEALLRERAAAGRVLGVHALCARSAHLILTRTPGMKPAVLEKGAEAVRMRLRALGIDHIAETTVDHDMAGLSAALAAAARRAAELTLILTGSATSDRGDVGPAALVAAGGRLLRFGMPVDPGNLLFLGELSGRPVVGLPGCARSPKLNGADWVIERLACGLDVSSDEIAAMGVGGLLKEIPSRPEPRGGGATAPQRPTVAAVLLAAGSARRMAGRDKLLEPVGGAPLLRTLVDRLGSSAIDEVVCVLRPDDPARSAALGGTGARIVTNPRAAEGMGTSIAAGVAALGPAVDAAVILLGDMPEITGADVDRLVAAFDPEEGRAIVRAVSADGAGAGGHPVLFGRRFFEALRGLEGDRGARAILAEHPEFVVDVTLAGRAAETDLDTPEAWARWRSEQPA